MPRILTPVALLFFLLHTASGVILYDNGGSSNNVNTSAPANGAPWEYVAQLGSNNPSGVYLGYNFLLTAHHVGTVNTGILLNGQLYDRDTSFTPLQIAPGVDLKLIRILGDPGLAPLDLYKSATTGPMGGRNLDLSSTGTLIGWGLGKGSEVRDGENNLLGWNWGGSRIQRWGTNDTLGNASTISYTHNSVNYSYTAIHTVFNSNAGVNEAAATSGDSGGALFHFIDGKWQLTGIATSVSTANASLFGDTNHFARISTYHDQIVTLIPEPSTAALALLGAAAMALRRRRAGRKAI